MAQNDIMLEQAESEELLYEIRIKNGDLLVDDSLEQTQRLLMATNKGDWRENPDAGIGVARYLESENTDGLAREIQMQMTRNGMKVNSININLPNIEMEAEYED